MKTDVLMPKMGMTMETGVVSEWLKSDGEYVILDDVIASIETDKITNQVTAPASGTLHIIASPFDEIPVGSVIGYIESRIEE